MSSGTQSEQRSSGDTLHWILEQLVAAGRSGREMLEFACHFFGERVIPGLERLVADVRSGRVSIKGLATGAQETLFGSSVAPEERERRVREAAYYRAQCRGSQPPDPEADWLEAEREVDAQLAADSGLMARAREAVESIGASTGRELVELKDALRRWLDDRPSRPDARSGGGTSGHPGRHD